MVRTDGGYAPPWWVTGLRATWGETVWRVSLWTYEERTQAVLFGRTISRAV